MWWTAECQIKTYTMAGRIFYTQFIHSNYNQSAAGENRSYFNIYTSSYQCRSSDRLIFFRLLRKTDFILKQGPESWYNGVERDSHCAWCSIYQLKNKTTQIAKFTGPTYGAHLGPVGPRWAPWTLPSGKARNKIKQNITCKLHRMLTIDSIPFITSDGNHKFDLEAGIRAKHDRTTNKNIPNTFMAKYDKFNPGKLSTPTAHFKTLTDCGCGHSIVAV